MRRSPPLATADLSSIVTNAVLGSVGTDTDDPNPISAAVVTRHFPLGPFREYGNHMGYVVRQPPPDPIQNGISAFVILMVVYSPEDAVSQEPCHD